MTFRESINTPARAARLLLMLLAATVAGGAAAQDYEKLDEIVAIVDEGVILRSELEAAIRNIEAQIRARGERMPPRQVLEDQVLERLISREVQMQRAEMTGIRANDQQVDRALDDVARQNNLTLAQLRQAVESEGGDFNEFREDIRSQIITSSLQQRIVESMDDITETEIDILLESDYFGGDEYHLSQIALRMPPDATPAQLRQLDQRIGEIYDEIRGGMEFAEAAINFSESADALEGGEIGWRNLNAMPRDMADAIRDLEAGEVSEPLQLGSSAVILKVNERRPRGEIIVDEFQARHILVQPSELMTPEQAQELIEDLHSRLELGEDFAELAREFSDDSRSANLGGLLEWYPEGAYGTIIQQVTDALEPGEFSQPFQTDQGWHILKLEGERQADRTEETLRGEARNLIMQQRADEEIQRTLRQFRDEAYVKKLLD